MRRPDFGTRGNEPTGMTRSTPASGEARRSFRGAAARWFAAGVCLLAFTGCAVGPDYVQPRTSVPSAWKWLTGPAEEHPNATTAAPVELVEWWKSFDDPMLTSLVERAIQSNLDVLQAKARIRQARAARAIAVGGLFPDLSASADYTRSHRGSGASSGSTSSGGTGGSSSINSDLFQAGLDAAWEIDVFGGLRRNVEASSADLVAAVEDRRDVLVSLVAEVGTNYLNLRGFQAQIAIARSNLEAQRHSAEITRKRYEAGFVGTLDVANARAQMATTEAEIPVLESSALSTIHNLGLLLGLNPTALEPELMPDAPIPANPPEVPAGLPSDLLRRRPDIRRAEAQLHAATARIGVATADLFPKFSLTGSFGFSSTDLSTFMNWSSRVASFGPSVTWPVFDAGKIRANIEVQNALQEQALLTYRKAVITAMRDVESALVAYAREQEHLRLLEEAVRQNTAAVDASLKLYTAGRSDFLNVLTAQRSLLLSEDALALSVRTMGTDLIALYKALGGGWEGAEAEGTPMAGAQPTAKAESGGGEPSKATPNPEAVP